MSGRGKRMAKKQTLLVEVVDGAVNLVYCLEPGRKPDQKAVAARAGKIGITTYQMQAWVDETLKLRHSGFARDQTLKSLPVVTGGEVQWQGKQPKEAKMAAVKKSNGSKVQIVAVLNKRFNGKCKIDSIGEQLKGQLGAGAYCVDFCKPKSKKLIRAVVRTAGKGSVTFTKEQPEQPKAKAKKSVKKAAKKSKATGRGKAVVVYFNTDNLAVLAAARKYAKKHDQSLASVVIKALSGFLK